MNNEPCYRCGNNNEEATPFPVMVDGTFMVLDLGCVADLRLEGRRVETHPALVRREAA